MRATIRRAERRDPALPGRLPFIPEGKHPLSQPFGQRLNLSDCCESHVTWPIFAYTQARAAYGQGAQITPSGARHRSQLASQPRVFRCAGVGNLL